MEALFSINNIVLTVLDYPISLAELLGTLFGLWSVALAAKAKVLNYPIGLINVVFFFTIFFQVQMYSDMILQIYFFIVSLYGWWKWKHPMLEEQTLSHELKITTNSLRVNVSIAFGIGIGLVAMGTFVKNLHLLLPQWFTLPAAFPYYDSFVAVGSIVAMYLMARKKLESWVLWVLVDAFCIVLYYLKNIRLISLEYVVFFGIASYGLWSWWKEYQGYHDQTSSLSLQQTLTEEG